MTCHGDKGRDTHPPPDILQGPAHLCHRLNVETVPVPECDGQTDGRNPYVNIVRSDYLKTLRVVCVCVCVCVCTVYRSYIPISH